MMNRVCGVTRAAAASTSIRWWTGSQSTSTGCPPARDTASAVAMKVLAGTSTSSPGSSPAARSDSSSASVPLATAMQWRTPMNAA